MSSPYSHAILNHGINAAGEAATEHILFGIPKKGRLAEEVLKLIKGAGLDHIRPNRLDVAKCNRMPVTLVFLPASDIAKYVAEGDVDMGITGEDIIAESQVDVVTLQSLGFGKCELAVQAPVGQYKDPAELAGKRIVTSFPNLAAQFFEQYDDGAETETSVKYVSGSVEVACSLGLADGVIDLVETGTTMRAAGLEQIGCVMKTQTVLIANKDKVGKPLVQKLNKRILGYVKSMKHSMLAYNIPKEQLPRAKEITPGSNGPTVAKLESGEDGVERVSITVMVNTKEVSEVMDQLEDIGATGLVVLDVTNCRV